MTALEVIQNIISASDYRLEDVEINYDASQVSSLTVIDLLTHRRLTIQSKPAWEEYRDWHDEAKANLRPWNAQ